MEDVCLDNVLAPLVPLIEGKRVLDVGCGSGHKLAWLLKHGANATGIDIDAAALDKAHKELPEAQLYECSADKLFFSDEFFDVVILSDVLEHVPNPQTVLDQCASVTKDGGYIFVTTPFSPLHKDLENHAGFNRWRTQVGHVVPGFTAEELTDMGAKARLRTDKVFFSVKGRLQKEWAKMSYTHFGNPLVRALTFVMKPVEVAWYLHKEKSDEKGMSIRVLYKKGGYIGFNREA